MLTKWYPNPTDPQFGSFIEKQAEAVSLYENVHLVFVYPSEKKSYEPDIRNNLYEHLLTYKKSSSKLVNFVRYLITLRYGVKKVVSKYGKPGLIHTHVLLRTAFFAFILHKTKKVPYFVSEHWSGFITGKFEHKNVLYKKMCKIVVKNASGLAVVSNFLKQAIQKNGLNNKNFKVIPNIIEAPANTQQKENKSNNMIMLTIADLVDEVKNVSEVIGAFAQVAAKFPRLEYHIIGDGPDREKIESIAKEHGLLNTRVFFHGVMENKKVMEFIPKIDFLVINSNVETFSMVAAEAMLFGKPVIATKCGGPEQFVNKDTGILIDKNHQKQLTEAITRMALNIKEYDAERIKQTIQETYSYKNVGKQLIEFYKLEL